MVPSPEDEHGISHNFKESNFKLQCNESCIYCNLFCLWFKCIIPPFFKNFNENVQIKKKKFLETRNNLYCRSTLIIKFGPKFRI